LKRARYFYIPILITAIFLQLIIPSGANAAPKGPEVRALEAGGPAETYRFPANSAATVPNINPKIAFGEKIQLAPGADTTIALWESGTPDVRVSATVQVDDSNQAIVLMPQSTLTLGKTYYVIIPSTAIYGYDSGKLFDGITGSNGWRFTVESLAPTAMSPNNVSNVDFSGIKLEIEFGKTMTAGSGFIQLKRDSDNAIEESFPVSAGVITTSGSGSKITFTSAKQMQPNTKYYVLVDPGALRDSVGNPYAGITSKTVWTFTTKPALDTTNPKVLSLNPTNGGTLGQLGGSLTLQFDKNVVAGSGNVTIRNASNNAPYCIVPVNTAGISISGSTVTINPGAYACSNFNNNTSYYVEIGSQAFRDASGNYFEGMSGASKWSFTTRLDTTPPSAVSFTPAGGSTNVNTNVTEFSIVFNEPVKLAPGATAQLFNSPSTRTNMGIAMDPGNNQRVVLTVPANTLRSAIQYSILIPNNAITDLTGNAFAGLLNDNQWTFKTLNTSSTPQLSDAKMDGSTIVLTFSEDLDATKVPNNNNFYVTLNDTPNSVTGVSVSGKEVRLSLQNGVLVGQTVRLTYYPDSFSSAKRLQNAAGREVAAFSNRSVTNTTSTTQPKPESGVYSDGAITVTFNRPLALMLGGYESQFTVRIGGSTVGVKSAIASGNMLYLTLHSKASGSQSVSVSYALGGSPLRDQSGNFVAGFTDFYVRNVSDTEAPHLLSAAVNGTKVVMTFHEGLNAASVPLKSSFSVLANNVQIVVSSVVINSNTVELTLNQSVPANTPVLIYYFPGNPPLTDLSGNLAAAVSGYSVVSGSGTAAQVSALSITGNQLVLTYSAILNSGFVPNASQYTVKYGTVTVPVSTVSVSGTLVTLTMSTAAAAGQTVTISYTTSGVPLRDALNQLMAAISNMAVVNRTGTNPENPNLNLPDYLESDGAGGVRLVHSKTVNTVTAVNSTGRTIRRYMVDGDKLAAAYALIKSGNSGLLPQVTIRIPSSETSAHVGIPVQALVSSASNVSNGQFVLDFGDTQFALPLKAINFSKELQKAGGSAAMANATLLLGIEKVSTTPLITAIASQGGTRLTTPADFTASLMVGSKEYPVDGYDMYVRRTFVVPATIGTDGISVVRLDELTGKVTYVPTTVMANGTSLNVNFLRKNNSVYAAVRKSVQFTDMKGHWANADVSLLASRFVLDGPTRTTFAPKKNITRADFAEYIVRGLGLNGDKEAGTRFKDVSGATAPFIGAASAAGIVKGGTDGKFRPNDSITREEMATMMVRAMSVAGVQQSAASSALNAYGDRSKVSSWAKDGVSICVQVGIISGTTATTLQPKNNASRAEAAIMIKRFLEYVEFL